jgi:hypothetical protein
VPDEPNNWERGLVHPARSSFAISGLHSGTSNVDPPGCDRRGWTPSGVQQVVPEPECDRRDQHSVE